jgi:flagellar biosynthesis/type III secretory pathway protein FliH
VNDDLIKRLRDKQNWITPSTFLILEAADALEAAQQHIAELEQQSEDNYTQGRKLGLHEALEAVKEVWLSNDYPTVGECVDTLQARIDAATADPACKSPESGAPSLQE